MDMPSKTKMIGGGIGAILGAAGTAELLRKNKRLSNLQKLLSVLAVGGALGYAGSKVADPAAAKINELVGKLKAKIGGKANAAKDVEVHGGPSAVTLQSGAMMPEGDIDRTFGAEDMSLQGIPDSSLYEIPAEDIAEARKQLDDQKAIKALNLPKL